MTKPLWAPWRLEYIKQAGEQDACVFCAESAGAVAPEQSLLVVLGESTLALLNKYPYSSGHVMVAPRRHVGELGELTDDETLEIHRLAVDAIDTLDRVYGPGGFNLGWNLGRTAGAGKIGRAHV